MGIYPSIPTTWKPSPWVQTNTTPPFPTHNLKFRDDLFTTKSAACPLVVNSNIGVQMSGNWKPSLSDTIWLKKKNWHIRFLLTISQTRKENVLVLISQIQWKFSYKGALSRCQYNVIGKNSFSFIMEICSW